MIMIWAQGGEGGRALQKMDQEMDRVYPCNHDACFRGRSILWTFFSTDLDALVFMARRTMAVAAAPHELEKWPAFPPERPRRYTTTYYTYHDV